MARVWITGYGIVCGAGCGAESAWQTLAEGHTTLGPVVRFLVPEGRIDWVATAPVLPELRHRVGLDDSASLLSLALARAAAEQALSGRELADRERAETALVWASNVEDQHRLHHELAASLADSLGLGGPRFGVSVACASATLALGLAARMIAEGSLARALVVAADVITPRVLAGFEVLGLLASEPCVPFSTRIGTSLGEGAGAVLLERVPGELALALRGWGCSNDAHHGTQPHAGGEGVARAVRAALTRAAIEPGAIDHIDAHGTGTAANDGAEWLGVTLGLAEASPPVASLKAAFGHTQGACGLVELVASLSCLSRGFHPPTLGFTPETRRAGAPEDVVGPQPRPGTIETLLSVNAGFGGANAAVVVCRQPEPKPESTAGARPPIFIAATGSCDPSTLATLDPRRSVRGVDLREAEAWTRALVVAIDATLSGARHRPSRHATTGLFVGQARTSLAQAHALAQGYETREGLYGASAHAFSQTFLAHPGTAAAAAFGLRGPFGVTTEGACAGLVALVHASASLVEGAAETMIASELGGTLETAWSTSALLTTKPPRTPGSLQLVAHAFGPSDASLATRDQVLRRAGWSAGDLDLDFAGDRDAPSLALTFLARAAQALATSGGRRACIRASQAGMLSCAILVETHGRA